MTNPNDGVGTNAGFNGRTTPNALNDVLGSFASRGIVCGWTCSPDSGMVVQLGGDGSTRDVAIAEDNKGNRTTINNRLEQPVKITIAGAPSTNSRIDSIVAYVDNPQNGAGASDVDFPSITGIIAVKGTAASSPSAPNESTIRTAITTDGGTGSTAFYVVLANITVGTNVTSITSGVIAQGAKANISNVEIANGAITTAKLASNAVTAAKLASNAVETAKIKNAAVTMAKIDFSSMTIESGNTGSITLSAGKWLIFASVNCLANVASGSFQSNISWLGTTFDFQGYRHSDQNRPNSQFTFTAVKALTASTTFAATATGDGELYEENWLAIKLG